MREHGQDSFGLGVEDLGRPLQDVEISYRPVELRSLMEQAGTEARPAEPREVEWPSGEHPERIAYIHLKDVDRDVLDGVRRDGVSFDDAVRRRVFTELGRGCLDVAGLLAALREIDYDGWLMVEQDSTWLTPAESAQVSRAYLRALGI